MDHCFDFMPSFTLSRFTCIYFQAW